MGERVGKDWDAMHLGLSRTHSCRNSVRASFQRISIEQADDTGGAAGAEARAPGAAHRGRQHRGGH